MLPIDRLWAYARVERSRQHRLPASRRQLLRELDEFDHPLREWRPIYFEPLVIVVGRRYDVNRRFSARARARSKKPRRAAETLLHLSDAGLRHVRAGQPGHREILLGVW